MFSSIFLPYLMGAVSVLKTDIKISFTAKAQSKLPKIRAPLVCSLSARQRGLIIFYLLFCAEINQIKVHQSCLHRLYRSCWLLTFVMQEGPFLLI